MNDQENGGTMNSKEAYTVKTIRKEGMTARIYIPDLSADERAKRMAEISRAAAQLLNRKE